MNTFGPNQKNAAQPDSFQSYPAHSTSCPIPSPKYQRCSDPRSALRDCRGQGLVEYLVIVALMGVATIAIVRVMGQTVTSRFASITYALQGVKKSASAEKVEESHYKKKDLGNFFDGVGATKGEGSAGD